MQLETIRDRELRIDTALSRLRTQSESDRLFRGIRTAIELSDFVICDCRTPWNRFDLDALALSLKEYLLGNGGAAVQVHARLSRPHSVVEQIVEIHRFVQNCGYDLTLPIRDLRVARRGCGSVAAWKNSFLVDGIAPEYFIEGRVLLWAIRQKHASIQGMSEIRPIDIFEDINDIQYAFGCARSEASDVVWEIFAIVDESADHD